MDNELNDRGISRLVWVAIGKKLSRRAGGVHNQFTWLEKNGYLLVVKQTKSYKTYTLTKKGEDAVLALSDDYAKPIFPYASDVANAKKAINELRSDMEGV